MIVANFVTLYCAHLELYVFITMLFSAHLYEIYICVMEGEETMHMIRDVNIKYLDK